MVTRGNVAIYCYNALTAKTWDVISSEDGKLTSSKNGDTILAKYFSDFVNEDGEMKLVESAKVVSTPINNNDLGISQIVLAEDEKGATEYEAGDDDETLGDFLNATTKAGKNREEKTYGDATITAYVVEGVCDNLASLQGKLVDVIFGKNNEVVYINVVDDAESGLFVTAWNPTKMEIELDGTTYEVATDATVSLFGSYAISSDVWSTKNAINAVMTELNVDNPLKNVERTISASIVLDVEDDELITSIDFTTSEDFSGAVDAYKPDGTKVQLGMEQAIVKSINSKTGKITTIEGASKTIHGETLEDLEDADVRVIKNNEIVTVEDITEGNLLTAVVENGVIKTIFISDNKVTGTLDRIKNEVLTIDGETYNAIYKIYGNTDGDIEEIDEVKDLAKDYLGEEVEVYLNFMGEVSVILSETEAVPATIGIVKDIYGTDFDREARVDYLEIKVLAADGTTERYYIYHEDDEEDMKYDEEDATKNTIADLAIGSVIWFSADDEGVIVYDEDPKDSEIVVVADAELNIKATEVEVDGKELEVKELGATSGNVDDDDQEVNGYLFDDEETVYFNNHIKVAEEDGDIEIIKGWSSLVKADDDTAFVSAIVLVDDDEVLYFVDSIEEYVSSKTEYAIVESIEEKLVDGELGTYVALVGSDAEYELDADDSVEGSVVEDGDFIRYTLKDDKITVTEVIDVFTLSRVEIDDAVAGLNKSVINEEGKKGTYEVEEVKDRKVHYVEYDAEEEETKLSLVKSSVTVFDVETGTVEDVNISDLEEVIVGKFVFGITADTDNEDKIDTLIVFDFED